ncbi:hypothetical protein M378DRAFT_18890 [Amanita muscaria Koide BX008]|uniref:Uncharacterized protein n=1 Tax=Amanita muscaria (strain Koide BX008) TaxID=946122 RepID=A0A0C2WEG4_AMAMK|nr:hypothetical protein M378DRAFT_18890 [Amanita muscaria Koide BX008]
MPKGLGRQNQAIYYVDCFVPRWRRVDDPSKGLLERQSLEDSCLIAECEDSSLSFRSAPVFSRPVPARQSRSTSSSGSETPPLSSDGLSVSGGSQSSIELDTAPS